jgi:hypothetical protein
MRAYLSQNSSGFFTGLSKPEVATLFGSQPA